MPIIENHTEHAFNFPPAPRMDANGNPGTPNSADALIFPPTRPGPLKADGTKDNVPGRLTISTEDLKRMQAHPVARLWFGPLSLRVVGSDEPTKAKG